MYTRLHVKYPLFGERIINVHTSTCEVPVILVVFRRN